MTSSSSPSIDKPCQFAQWHFDPADGQLRSKDKKVRLQPRLSKLLAIFLANVDVLLTREELIDILWRDKAVNEDALSRCIAELRATLGDNRQSPIYIETVPKRGYRFIQPLVAERSKKVVFSVVILVGLFIGGVIFNGFVNKKRELIELSARLKSGLIAAERVTADTSFEHQPELSNSGDKVAFSVVIDNKLIVKIVNLEGELLHEIKESGYHLYSPTFSHDDREILIAGVTKEKCIIYRYQLLSMQRTVIGNCLLPNTSGIFDWSPDGKNIAYVAGNEKKNEKVVTSNDAAIWIYNLATKEHTQITNPTSLNIFDTRPRFSPDGKKLGFTRGTQSSRQLYLIDMEAPSNVKQLTTSYVFIAGFSWLKDNQNIVFDSDEQGDRKLWLFNLESKNKQLLGARDAQFPSLNKNNTLLTFQEIRYTANIWSVDLNSHSSQPNRIIESSKYDNFPAFSPDGKQIAFTSNRQGKSAIWLYSTETQQQTKLLAIPGLSLFMPSWSFDGKKLLISSRGGDGYQCYEVSVKSGKYRRLSAIRQAHFGCVYSGKSDIFAISRAAEEAPKLLKLNEKNEVEILTQDSVSRVQVTNFGALVYSLSDRDGLYTVDFKGEKKEIVLENFKQNFDDHWMVQGSYLYYPKLNEEKGIWRRDLMTGSEERVTSELPSAIGLTLSVNPEHSQLVFSRTDSRQSDIYVSDLKLMRRD